MWRMALVVALLIGWLRGGSLRTLSQYRIKVLGALVAAALIQVGVAFTERYSGLGSVAPQLHILSYLPLFWGLWANREKPGIWIVTAGTFLNFLVITVNGGMMPVSEPALHQLGDSAAMAALEQHASYTHELIMAGTRLPMLGDVLVFPDLKVFPITVVSIGDAIMALGFVVFIYVGMTRTHNDAEDT